MAQLTLLRHLTQPDPKLVVNQAIVEDGLKSSRGKGSTRNEAYPEIKRIEKWTEFSRKNLRRCFNGALENLLRTEHAPFQSRLEHPRGYRRIYAEDGFRELVGVHHRHIVAQALEKTAVELLNEPVDMVTGTSAFLVYNKPHAFQPDYMGTRPSYLTNKNAKDTGILPGDAKTSWSWNSESLKPCFECEAPGEMREELKTNWGLRQIVQYCICASARYGYILNDKELYVLRVSPDRENAVEPADNLELLELTWENPVVQGISIPWHHDGDDDNDLTICLALWAIHLLAANDGSLKYDSYQALAREELLSVEERWCSTKPLPTSSQDSFQSVRTTVEGNLAEERISIPPSAQTSTLNNRPRIEVQYLDDSETESSDNDDELCDDLYATSQHGSFDTATYLSGPSRPSTRATKRKSPGIDDAAAPIRKSSRIARGA